MPLKQGFYPTQRTQRTQRKGRNGRNATNATNAAEATLLAIKPQKSRLKYRIIEIKFDSHHKLHN